MTQYNQQDRPWHPEHPESKHSWEDDTDAGEESPVRLTVEVDEEDAQGHHQLHAGAQGPTIPWK